VLQPGDTVHLVMGVPPTADPTLTMGQYLYPAVACIGQYI